jgi:hypothetical protein
MATDLPTFIRERRGDLSRDELAEKARALAPAVKGLHRTSIQRWEDGEGKPSADQLRAVIQAGGGTDEHLSQGLSLLVGVPVVVRSDDEPPAAVA